MNWRQNATTAANVGWGAQKQRQPVSNLKTARLVSVVIPCRNEGMFIRKCLESILANSYPKENLEILVVDGMSEDTTRQIVAEYAAEHPFIRIVDNPRKVTPVALNIGITESDGEIVIRMDAHAEYPPRFISTCMDFLERTGADVVGGPVITRPSADSLEAKSIAFVTSHPFGVGNSRFRTSQREGYVDTVPFGAYKRRVFQEVGLFDERLVRNQDNELSSRIIKKGGKIYLTPELVVHYYNQSNLKGLLKQALRTGRWNALTVSINPAAFRSRHFVPFLFVTCLLLLGALAPIYRWSQVTLLAFSGLYGSVALASSIQIGLREGLKFAIFLPIVFFLYHVCYGFGTWAGLLQVAFGSLAGTFNSDNRVPKMPENRESGS